MSVLLSEIMILVGCIAAAVTSGDPGWLSLFLLLLIAKKLRVTEGGDD